MANRMVQRLIFVCCGATEGMRRGAFPRDEPADARYLSRAAALAASLPRVGGVLTSPALRARQTAAAFADLAAEEAALAEQDFGAWAGHELARVREADAVALGAWLSDPAAAPPGGESFVHVCGRVGGFMAGVLERAGAVVAVTHPAVIRAAILTTLGAPPACFSRIDVEPLGLTEFRGDGRRWMLRATGAAISGAG
jgi:broad specificity phosphatase PhoE